jgi:hypothetical protein
VVRIPDEYDPSPVKEMLRDKGLDVEIESPDELGFEDDITHFMIFHRLIKLRCNFLLSLFE